MILRPASDRSVLVELEQDPVAVRRAFRALEGLPGVVNLHPAYASVLVEFEPRLIGREAVCRAIRERMSGCAESAEFDARTVEIPVRYGGPDMEDVARHTGLSAKTITRVHSSADYLVCFLGFSPGFPYLSGMPPELAAPRLERPRKRVRAGSVAIGGSQTGIYPVDSPGGWRIIGHTDVRLFRPEGDPPVLLSMGDRVRFVPIGEDAA